MLRTLMSAFVATVAGGVVLVPGVATAAEGPRCDGQDATIVGTAGDDDLVGTAHSDVIVARGGNDVVRGLSGDDVLCGGPGRDRLFGSGGDDRLLGGLDQKGYDRGGPFIVGDVLEGGSGNDRLNAGWDARQDDPANFATRDQISFAHASTGVSVELRGAIGSATGEGSDTIWLVKKLAIDGSPYADVIEGSDRDDVLSGERGDDRIDGFAGDDVIYADDYNGPVDGDIVNAGAGDDVVYSETGRDHLFGGDGKDNLIAYGNLPTQTYGEAGDDYLDTRLSRYAGLRALGGPGTDSLVIRAAFEPEGRPQVRINLITGAYSWAVSDTATGVIDGVERLQPFIDHASWRIRGTDADETIWGLTRGPIWAALGGGNDTMRGTDANDYFDGGPGTDEVDGRGGTDTCLNAETVRNCP